MKSFYLTDAGKVRDHNEDSVIIVKNKNNECLMAIADGMGGHSAGEVASSIAIGYLGKHFQETFLNLSKVDAVEWIRNSTNEINSLIFQHEKTHPESKGMGTTLVLAIITEDYILFGNVGDSSGYVMKDNKLHKVTYDHTLVNLLVSAGELTKEEAKEHPKKNVLMKALGANDPVEIDVFDCDMEIDEILLCSDGLTNMLENDQIERVLLGDSGPKEKVEKLVVSLKYESYRWNLFRLALEYKYAFLLTMHKELVEAREKGLFDKSYFTDRAWENANRIVDDMDGYFDDTCRGELKKYGSVEELSVAANKYWKKSKKLQKKIDDMEASTSLKVGRTITCIPRKIKKALRK